MLLSQLCLVAFYFPFKKRAPGRTAFFMYLWGATSLVFDFEALMFAFGVRLTHGSLRMDGIQETRNPM